MILNHREEFCPVKSGYLRSNQQYKGKEFNDETPSFDIKIMYLDRTAKDPEGMKEAMSIIQSAQNVWDSAVTSKKSD